MCKGAKVMRLFIAINFTDEIKQRLILVQERLRKFTINGNFTHKDNMHLTLVFLGETEPGRVSLIKNEINKTTDKNNTVFSLKAGGLDCFKKDNGDIWWLGIDKCIELMNLQKQLTENLAESGFSIEKRNYSPHLTLSRDTVINSSFDKADIQYGLESFIIIVERISLMKSERINGRLTYTEIYSKKLLIN